MSSPVPDGALIVTAGPTAGQTLPLAPLITVGRADDNTLVIKERSVSHHHLRLDAYPQGYAVTDLNSSNGTLLNGVRLTQNAWLQDGDVLSLGPAVQIRFQAPVAQPDQLPVAGPLPDPAAAAMPAGVMPAAGAIRSAQVAVHGPGLGLAHDGTLSLYPDRLRFDTDNGKASFDFPLQAIAEIKAGAMVGGANLVLKTREEGGEKTRRIYLGFYGGFGILGYGLTVVDAMRKKQLVRDWVNAIQAARGVSGA